MLQVSVGVNQPNQHEKKNKHDKNQVIPDFTAAALPE